ncbi:MAG TPA: secretin N-terminal domain-containing protein [bacterium]|nr:hypothetical protein [Candidatus Omnitrophota bacterium]HOL94182.1 secretin N-terminal domain-containing protein [bacterium]HPP02130.1 secretin N-terminal domain-containing protein [bacterium]
MNGFSIETRTFRRIVPGAGFLAAGFLTAGILAVLTVAVPMSLAQDNPPDSAPAEATAGSTNAGLGGLFADSLKNLLQTGTLFVPNGETARPVSGEPGAPEKFRLNFNNAPIDQVLKFLSDMTKKVVLKSDDVQGQFTIVNPNEVTKEEAMGIIDTAFMLKGFTFLETDQMIVVLPVSLAKQKGVDVQVGQEAEKLGSRVQTRIVELKYARPTQMRQALSPLISESASLIADDRSKTLVITDTGANIDRLVAIINQLDKETTVEGVVIRVFRLRYLNATELARSLNDMIANIVAAKTSGGETRDRRQEASMTSEVVADRYTNSLIIAAPDFAIKTIEEFILKMDVSSMQNMVTKTFQLKSGDAREIAQGLQQFTQSRRTNFYQPVVFADSRTNSIVIHAYPEDVNAIENVLNQLDNQDSYERITRVFMLENADAIVLSQMLQQLITGQTSNQRSWWGYGRGMDDQNQIKIVEDQRLNALIVTAKPADIPMVEELIKELDRPLPESKEEPRVYRIQYVRAADVAYLIEQVFSANQQSMGYNYFFGWGGSQPQGLTGLTGKVKTIADTTTNSLIVIAASPRAFEVVEKLIEKLDRLAPEFGTTRVFPLKNASAAYLAEQLNALFQEDPARSRNQGFFWYMNQQGARDEQISQMIGQVRIVSETRTNSLMVTTSSQYFDAIEQLINELDREISQVLIEVLIVELIDVQDDQYGINWPDTIPVYVEATLDAPANAIGLDRATILSQASFSAAIDMLQSDSRTNVLARPNILTGDNQGAFVEVINEVPILGTISQGNVTTQQEIDYREVGLKLNVTPHINDATTVTIDVDLESGQVLDQFALITPSGKSPAFSRRTVTTRLTLKHEETAVLSGVIDTSFTESNRGVPGLMKIPIIGNLFKSRGKSTSKTELLTFITPYILADQNDRLAVFDRHKARIERYEKFRNIMKEVDVRAGVSP